MRIYADDIMKFHCARGMKTWFTRHGLDFRSFLENGISEEDFLATEDFRAEQIVAAKKRVISE